jgi:hypothetical protein
MMSDVAAFNPFDALPPLSLDGDGASKGSGNPFDDLPPLDLHAKSAPVVSPNPGALANSPDDGYGSSFLKGAGTTLIRGVGDVPGIFGNIGQAYDAGTRGLTYLAAKGAEKMGFLPPGKTAEDFMQESDKLDKAFQSPAEQKGLVNSIAGVPFPTGKAFSDPVLQQTGEYVPESPLARVLMAGGEAGIGGSVFGPAGVAGKLSAAAENAVGGVAGQSATEAGANPLVSFLVGGAGQHAAHVGGNVVTQGVGAIADAVPPITEAQKAQAARRTVGTELNASASDPAAAQASLEGRLSNNGGVTVEGSEPTLAPLSRDSGLLSYEKGVSQSPEGKAAYADRMAAQNAARQKAIAGIQPEGDALALPEAIQGNLADADAKTQSDVEAAKASAAQGVQEAQQAHQSAIANVQALKPDASPLDVAAHFKSVRDAMETDAESRVAREQNEADRARAVASPVGQSPEQIGAALRTPFDANNAAKTAAVSGLYKALPKDMVGPGFGIAGQAKEVLNSVLPETRLFGGMPDEDLLKHAADYGDEVPVANINALRSTILSARASLRQSDPQAWGRLSTLLPPIEAALDHAIENRAALDSIAVRRGAMAPEDAIGPKVDKAWKDELDRQNYNLSVGQESYGQDAGSYASGRVGGNGASGAQGGGNIGSGGNSVLSRGSTGAVGQDISGAGRKLVTSLPTAPKDLSLNRYLAGLGGIKPTAEVRALFDRTESPRYSTGSLLRNSGMTLDEALQTAKEGGYLFDPADFSRGPATLSHRDLLDKIAEDHRTGEVAPYNSANEDWRSAMDARAHERELRAALPRIGVNPAKVDANVIGDAVSHMLGGDGPLEAFGKAGERHLSGGGYEPAKESQRPEEEPISRPDWQVTGSPDLRKANAAYREKKLTFDEGPIGEAFAKNGRGEPDYSNAELAGKVFHGRATAGEDMRAYLKAAGEGGVSAASDAAALSFRNAAMKNGVVDTKAAETWLNNPSHKLALGELPDSVREKFATATDAQKAVAETFAKTRDDLAKFDKSEAGKIAGLSANGDIVKHVGSILESNSQPEAKLAELSAKAASNPAAADGLKRAVIEHVFDKFVPEEGQAKPDKLGAYIASKRDVLSKVLSPSEIDNIMQKTTIAEKAAEGVKAATAAGDVGIKSAEASRKEALSRYDKGVLGALKNASGSEDTVINAVRRALNADNGEIQMDILAKEAAKKPGGSDALKKAVATVVQKDVQSLSQAGTSGIFQMKDAALQKFMNNRIAAFKAAGLSDQQIGVMKAVTENSLETNLASSATAIKRGSDTNANLAQSAKMAKAGGGSILSHVIVDSALAAAGHMAGGIFGAFLGKTLGDRVMGAMREAGLDRVQKLRVEAVMNPQVGLALMKEFPLKPNHGAAAELGLRLRQLSLAGILAAQKH